MPNHKKNGFTLIELIMAVVIAGVLTVVAVPSLSYVYESTRTNSAINTFESSLMFSRNQAVSFGRRISICPGDGTGCSSNWIDGFAIFIDDNQDGIKDNNTDVLRFVDAFNSDDFINASTSRITFNTDGLLTGSQQTITYCPSAADSESSKQVAISASGRIQTITTGVNCT